MRFLKSPLLISATALVALLVAGCGAGSNAAGGGAYGGGATNTPASASTATTAPATGGTIVKTASVSVGGTMKTVLVAPSGLTLYYHTPDTATSVWTNVTSWPPLLSAGGTPTSITTLIGKLAILTDANGPQVTYNSHPLYTFAGDSAPGQANGDGLGGVWYVVTPALAASTANLTATKAPCVGYYCH